MPAAQRVSTVPRAHMDYAFLQEDTVETEDEFEEGRSASASMTILVMFETLCESVWAYSVRAKGIASDAWLPDKLAQDLATVGVANTSTL